MSEMSRIEVAAPARPVAAVRRGGFDEFYAATSRRLLHQMYAMTGNLADAQECVQEAYARAWQRWGQVREADNPEAWLRTVAWRVAASRWRKTKNGAAALLRVQRPEARMPCTKSATSYASASVRAG